MIAKFGEGIQDEMTEFKQEFNVSKEEYLCKLYFTWKDVENSLGVLHNKFYP